MGELMEMNNEMMMACRQRAWWSKYLWGGAALAVLGVALYYAQPQIAIEL